MEWGDKIPLGIIYRNQRTSFEKRFSVLQHGPLVGQDTNLAELKKILEKFA